MAKSKVVSVRLNEKEQALVKEYGLANHLKKPSQAIKHFLFHGSPSTLLSPKDDGKEKLEQTNPAQERRMPKPSSFIFSKGDDTLPYELQQEVDRFLRGQGIDRYGNVSCPTVEAILGLTPNSKIETSIHNPRQ